MPITGWNCPSCKRTVPLDHFATSACGAVIHPDYAAAVLADRELQEDRTGVRVSTGLSCPRRYAITATENFAADPLGMLAPLKGTAWHTLMESGCTDMGFDGAEIEVTGQLGGIEVTGKIDRVRYIGDQLIGEDWKTGSDFRAKYVKKDGAPMEYRVQLSLYADLYRQQFNRTWDAAAIWWAFSNEMWAEPIAILPVEKCLAHQPYNCGYTVLDLYKQAAEFTDGKAWAELPLVGEQIKFGAKTGCDYCAVRNECWTQAKSAPF